LIHCIPKYAINGVIAQIMNTPNVSLDKLLSDLNDSDILFTLVQKMEIFPEATKAKIAIFKNYLTLFVAEPR
jgi:hypothetical protein